FSRDWSSDVCSSDLETPAAPRSDAQGFLRAFGRANRGAAGVSTGRRCRLALPELLEAVRQRARADAQGSRRFLPVAAVMVEGGEDQRAFGSREGRADGYAQCTLMTHGCGVAKEWPHGSHVDLFAFRQNVGAGDGVLQLTDIAGPVVLLQAGDGGGREHLVAFFLSVQLIEKLLSQIRDIRFAFSQGGHPDGK